jgi:signal transduction histidine kinase
MKITTRIITGYALLIAVLAGVVIYQVYTIRKIKGYVDIINKNVQNFATSLEAKASLEKMTTNARKVFGTEISYLDYLDNLRADQDDFGRIVHELQKNATAGEKEDVANLSAAWHSFNAELDLQLPNLPQKQNKSLPSGLEQELKRLERQIDDTITSSNSQMHAKVGNAAKEGNIAVNVLMYATAFALAVSILVSFLIYHSISKPLQHLTEGTRAIAEGKFFYRLDTTRNDEFAQLAMDFNTMTRRLNELDEMKKDFVSHVSHELKAPLASMKETIQLMLEQIPGPLTDKQKRLLELNLQSGNRLTAMISNLLDLSRTEAGVMQYELKSQDLLPLVRTGIRELEVQARERQIQIKTGLPEKPLPVECDSDRIVQVILNLVGNAVKFSPRAAVVRVDVEPVSVIPQGIPEQWRRLISASKGYYGLVTVADSGPGVLDTDKEKIFEKFHQVKQGKKIAGQGVGLGLAICRTIVQAHRGAIWVEDNPGGGSRFMVLLRAGEAGEEPVPRASYPI